MVPQDRFELPSDAYKATVLTIILQGHLVTPSGFEPENLRMKTACVRPLHHGAIKNKISPQHQCERSCGLDLHTGLRNTLSRFTLFHRFCNALIILWKPFYFQRAGVIGIATYYIASILGSAL